MTDHSPAVQILDTTWDYHTCFRLGGSLADSSTASVEFGLYDPMNPAEGIYMLYKGDVVSCLRVCVLAIISMKLL